jgi:NDP-sugar pyrophosphorylase family protein
MELAATEADVALVAHEDGTPGGVMLARCRSLRCIPIVGYVDMKEQALPLMARRSQVKAILRGRPVGSCVRTRGDYIRAMRRYHDPVRAVQDAFAESWSPVFSICEPGAEVDSSARVHDSVVLRGSRVERGAVVVRSVVCPGAVVRRNQMVVDQLVCGA